MLTYKNPKAKSCVVCERVFVPERMGQVVCRGSCGLKKARAEREAAEKAERESVTQTVVDEAKRECAKAGMTLEGFLRVWCRRGSQGLEAAWLKPDERAQGQAAGETPYQRSMRERMQEAAPEIARRAPAAPPQDAADFFRTVDAQSRVVDVKAIEVTT